MPIIAIFIMHPDGFVINTWVFIGIFLMLFTPCHCEHSVDNRTTESSWIPQKNKQQIHNLLCMAKRTVLRDWFVPRNDISETTWVNMGIFKLFYVFHPCSLCLLLHP